MFDKQKSPPVQQVPSESSFTAGLMLGAALGAGAFFLFGTKKGRKIKDELIEVGQKYLTQWEEELKESAPEIHAKYAKIKERSEDAVEKVKEQLPQLQENVQELSAKAVETVELAKQELPVLQQKTAEIAAKAQEAIETLREELPEKREEVEKEIEKLQESMVEAAAKAEEMEQQLKSTAASIERKFFFKKGKSLKK